MSKRLVETPLKGRRKSSSLLCSALTADSPSPALPSEGNLSCEATPSPGSTLPYAPSASVATSAPSPTLPSRHDLTSSSVARPRPHSSTNTAPESDTPHSTHTFMSDMPRSRTSWPVRCAARGMAREPFSDSLK